MNEVVRVTEARLVTVAVGPAGGRTGLLPRADDAR
jgi:hypothetical protein